MTPRILLDTHIVVRWLAAPGRLSREQERALDHAVRLQEQVAVSAISFLEIALLSTGTDKRMKLELDEVFGQLESNPIFQILPLTAAVAREVSVLSGLRDPADRVIVATARVHGLRLLTSDQRILESNLASTIE